MASGTWNTGSWSQNQWGDNANPTISVTGFGMSAALGDETSSTEINTGWGRQEWGLQGWGIAGTLIPTGSSLSGNLGTLGMQGDVAITLTGQALTAALGTETVEGHATVTANTLNVAQLTLGAVDPAPDAMIIGEAMIGSLGTLGFQGDVAHSVTGIALTANLGSATVDLNTPVNVTGIGMLSRVASATAFTDVSTTFNGFGLTMNLNSANALIWNEINTGSAPIDPPGWREVVA